MMLSVAMVKMAVDYKDYAQKVFHIVVPRPPTADTWRSPTTGWIKMTFDAFIGAEWRRGLRIVCRDDKGQVLLTGSRLCQAN